MVQHREVVNRARRHMRKHGTLAVWIKAHVGHTGNEEADKMANLARMLLSQPKPTPGIGEYVHAGMIAGPGCNKRWTTQLVPKHVGEGVHPELLVD